MPSCGYTSLTCLSPAPPPSLTLCNSPPSGLPDLPRLAAMRGWRRQMPPPLPPQSDTTLIFILFSSSSSSHSPGCLQGICEGARKVDVKPPKQAHVYFRPGQGLHAVGGGSGVAAALPVSQRLSLCKSSERFLHSFTSVASSTDRQACQGCKPFFARLSALPLASLSPLLPPVTNGSAAGRRHWRGTAGCAKPSVATSAVPLRRRRAGHQSVL